MFYWFSIILEWPHAQQGLSTQHAYYSQYAPILDELTSYQQKLQQEGLAPAFGQEWSSHFAIKNDAPPQTVENHETSVGPKALYNHNLPYYLKRRSTTREPKVSTTTVQTTPHITNEHKGKDKINQVVIKNESEHAKKPIFDFDTKWPNIKHDTELDKQHANVAILNESLSKISEKVEEKKTAIKNFVDSSVDNINKTADGIYQQIGSESSKLIEKINKQLKTIENYLEQLNFGSIKRIDEDSSENFEDDDADHQPQKPNVVHSEIGKKLRSLELLDMNAELRGDLKTSISDAVKNAQDRFNKLIDEQIAKINRKIADVTDRFEAAFNKFQDTFSRITVPTFKPTITKVYTPPTYRTTTTKAPKLTTPKPSTSYWKSKSTTTPISAHSTKLTTPKPSTSYLKLKATTTPSLAHSTKFYDYSTTPEYFKYTVPTPKYKLKSFVSSDTVVTDLNRMDADVDDLKIADDAKNERVENEDAVVKMDSAAAAVDEIEEEEEEQSEPSDELKIEVDTVKSLDDLQSQVLEIVKDTLKSDTEDLESIENNQSEILENPEDKLESEKILESTFAEELRNELKEERKASTEGDEISNVDNFQAENLDDLAKKETEIEHEADEATVTNGSDGVPKLFEIDEDGVADNEDKEARFDDLSGDSPLLERNLNRRKNLDGVDIDDNEMLRIDETKASVDDEGNL